MLWKQWADVAKANATAASLPPGNSAHPAHHVFDFVITSFLLAFGVAEMPRGRFGKSSRFAIDECPGSAFTFWLAARLRFAFHEMKMSTRFDVLGWRNFLNALRRSQSDLGS